MADCDKIKPSLIKELESKNALTIIANHYGSSNMRLENIKLPNIELYDISKDLENCLTSLKQKKSFVQYTYFENNDNLKLVIITPKVYDKKIGPKFIKYITLSYFSMIGTINKEYITELEKLAFL